MLPVHLHRPLHLSAQPIKKHRASRERTQRVSRVTKRHEKVDGFCDFEFASPFEGGLGGSVTLLVRFLETSEKMNELVFNLNFKFSFMIKVNWNNVAKVLKFLATVITTVAGTLAVQSCAPHWF